MMLQNAQKVVSVEDNVIAFNSHYVCNPVTSHSLLDITSLLSSQGVFKHVKSGGEN